LGHPVYKKETGVNKEICKGGEKKRNEKRRIAEN
jgi:hypothetical protein